MNKNLKRLTVLTVYVASLMAAENVKADDLLNSESALTAFKNRTFLSENDAIQWATAIQDLVGVYVVKINGQITSIGDYANEKGSSKRLDLKDGKKRIVFHKTFEEKQDLNFSFANIFSLGGNQNELDELIISDVVSVTDVTVNSSTCLSKKPSTIDSDTMFWCVSAITLSEINNNKYRKTNKLASGSYGIATASGIHQKDDSLSSSRIVASISVIGPFKNGKLALGTDITPKTSALMSSDKALSMPTGSTGLEGKIITIHK